MKGACAELSIPIQMVYKNVQTFFQETQGVVRSGVGDREDENIHP